MEPDEQADPWVQMNVRVRKSQRAAIEERRNLVGISRDEWCRRALTWALTTPVGTPTYPELPRPEVTA